jgi:riboflavin synthase
LFTGIVQRVANIQEVDGNNESRTFTIQFPKGFCASLQKGASVSVNGVCLTATEKVADDRWKFDVMLKSLLACW